MALVGEPKQIIHAQSGLDVFEGDVIDRLAARKWVLQVRQHLSGRRPNVDFATGSTKRPHQRPGIAFRLIGRRKAGQGVGENVAAGKTEAIHRARRHDERLRRIETAGNADDSPPTWMPASGVAKP